MYIFNKKAPIYIEASHLFNTLFYYTFFDKIIQPPYADPLSFQSVRRLVLNICRMAVSRRPHTENRSQKQYFLSKRWLVFAKSFANSRLRRSNSAKTLRLKHRHHCKKSVFAPTIFLCGVSAELQYIC